MNPTASIDYQAKVEALQQPELYPEETDTVETRETHMAWVFLTELHAYKMKKPVRYSFLDFSTLELRKTDCLLEVALNRRLAPDVYHGIVPLVLRGGRLALDVPGEPVEWLVKMRRLPAGKMLDRHVVADEDTNGLVATALRLARFYRSQEPVRFGPDEYLERLRRHLEIDTTELIRSGHGLEPDRIHALHLSQLRLLKHHADLFADRARQGRIIEGHGDLRPEHVCLEDPPVIFDCLEFSRDLRTLDPIADLAHLVTECNFLDPRHRADLVFPIYAETTGDAPSPLLVRFHKIERAMLRARLSILHLEELPAEQWRKWQDQAIAYLELADHCRTGE
jgi:uncharacterized protein